MKTKTGFTLFEILIAMTLSIIVIMGTLSVFLSIQKISYEVGDVVTMNTSTRMIRNQLLRDFRSIQSVSVSSENTFSATFVEFETGLLRNVQYTFDNGKLWRSIDGSARQAVLQDISTSANQSHFIYKTRTGDYVTQSPADQIIGLNMYIVPLVNGRQLHGMSRNVNIPYKTAVVFFRNIGVQQL